jgi:hypothetical protein
MDKLQYIVEVLRFLAFLLFLLGMHSLCTFQIDYMVSFLFLSSSLLLSLLVGEAAVAIRYYRVYKKALNSAEDHIGLLSL